MVDSLFKRFPLTLTWDPPAITIGGSPPAVLWLINRTVSVVDDNSGVTTMAAPFLTATPNAFWTSPSWRLASFILMPKNFLPLKASEKSKSLVLPLGETARMSISCVCPSAWPILTPATVSQMTCKGHAGHNARPSTRSNAVPALRLCGLDKPCLPPNIGARSTDVVGYGSSSLRGSRMGSLAHNCRYTVEYVFG